MRMFKQGGEPYSHMGKEGAEERMKEARPGSDQKRRTGIQDEPGKDRRLQ